MKASIEVRRKNETFLSRILSIDGPTSIGRGPDNVISIASADISRKHATIFYDGSCYYYKDHSTHGSYIRGELLHNNQCQLKHGDVVVIAGFELIFREGAVVTANLESSNTIYNYEMASNRNVDYALFRSDRKEIKIDSDVFTIGSHANNHLVVDDSEASETQCTLRIYNGRLYLENHNALTHLNGAKAGLVPLLLNSKDVLKIGKETFEVISYQEKVKNTHGIIHKSAVMAEVIAKIERYGEKDKPVLIIGETGTGKELVAKALHAVSKRRQKPYVVMNCANLKAELAELMLFGGVRGSYTGSIRDQRGYFSEADGGTLFLDEVGELPMETQAKLLRVVQEGTFRPLGAEKDVRVDVRLIAATNRNINDQQIRSEIFREDLYHRLSLLNIELPALSERIEDIPVLMDHFLTLSILEDKTLEGKMFDVAAYISAQGVSWPGNVRDLYKSVYQAAVDCDGDIIKTILRNGNKTDKKMVNDEALPEVIHKYNLLNTKVKCFVNYLTNFKINKMSVPSASDMSSDLKLHRTTIYNNYARLKDVNFSDDDFNNLAEYMRKQNVYSLPVNLEHLK